MFMAVVIEANFNPLRPRGRRLAPLLVILGCHNISTHSAREDGDINDICREFDVSISTHSAREDGDMHRKAIEATYDDFNPLRPRGRRLYVYQALRYH